jgi:hypothetical protein
MSDKRCTLDNRFFIVVKGNPGAADLVCRQCLHRRNHLNSMYAMLHHSVNFAYTENLIISALRFLQRHLHGSSVSALDYWRQLFPDGSEDENSFAEGAWNRLLADILLRSSGR